MPWARTAVLSVAASCSRCSSLLLDAEGSEAGYQDVMTDCAAALRIIALRRAAHERTREQNDQRPGNMAFQRATLAGGQYLERW
jgi:hypothetical protein